MKKLFIQAVNIHQGGGLVLLSELLNDLPSGLSVVCNLDRRAEIQITPSKSLKVRKIKPSILGRMRSELWLKNNVREEDIVLCFGNLPPFFKLLGYVHVFLQNRHLVEKSALGGFAVPSRLRIMGERIWLHFAKSHVDEFIVQTYSMKTNVLNSLDVDRELVNICPFANKKLILQQLDNTAILGQESIYDYVYVASGEPHKNHRRLIEAWCALAEDGVFPVLCITLSKDKSSELCTWIEGKILKYGLKVQNVGMLTHEMVEKVYGQAEALIFPSYMESFGLPLIEAKHAGLAIIASELDYVRDVVNPEQTFNPYSHMSIARAIKRHMGFDNKSIPLLEPREFIAKIMNFES